MLVFLLILLILFLIGLYSVTKKRTVEQLEADEQSSDAERVRVDKTDVTAVESKPKRPTTPQQITIETPLGQLTFIPKRNKPHVVIACGRSEEGIRWEFDVFLKRELKDAVANAKRYRKEGKPRSYWSDGYLEYILNAEDRFNNLERDRDFTISRNGVDLAERRISVVGEFEAEGMIEANMEFLRKLGWLDLHAIEVPESLLKRQRTKRVKS